MDFKTAIMGSLISILVVGCSEKPEDKARREATEECNTMANALATPAEKANKEAMERSLNKCIEGNFAKKMRQINQSTP